MKHFWKYRCWELGCRPPSQSLFPLQVPAAKHLTTKVERTIFSDKKNKEFSSRWCGPQRRMASRKPQFFLMPSSQSEIIWRDKSKWNSLTSQKNEVTLSGTSMHTFCLFVFFKILFTAREVCCFCCWNAKCNIWGWQYLQRFIINLFY